mgnify:FL=1
MNLVTKNNFKCQLFRLLPPGWEDCVHSWYNFKSGEFRYQWRFGMNPPNAQWLEPITIGTIRYTCHRIARKPNLNIHQYTLCWVGAPQHTISLDYNVICASQVVIYRAMTVAELRKTDDFLYRLVIAHAVATGPNILRDVTLVTDLDCFCYMMYIEVETELTAIPEYARTVIVQFFAPIMFPNNTGLPTDDGAVNTLLNRVVFDHPTTQL